jgi:predicted ATPase
MGSVKDRLANALDYVRREKTRVEVKEAEITTLSIKSGEKTEENVILAKVGDLFKQLGGANEEELLRKIEQFVTYGLQRVFGEEFRFVVLMEQTGKDVKVEFKLRRGESLIDIVDACGGGIAEVVGLLLQLFFVLMTKDRFAPMLFLDTALVHLSDDYIDKMSLLLRSICYDLGVQVVLCTHSKNFGNSADKLYTFSQIDGKTQVEVVK